jgi:RNA polymerase sigma-70 factor (ECF subfamily)
MPLGKLTDKMLIDAHIKGESGAFEQIIRRHGAELLGYLQKMTRNREQAEDVFQETFKKVHENAHTLSGDNFKGWMYRIATNTALDNIRKNKKHQAVKYDNSECIDGHCEAVVQKKDNPISKASKSEQAVKVRQSLNKLPDKQRAAVTLAYYQHMTYREVAEVLGCSLGAVKTQMFRALKTLAATLPELAGEIQ